LHDIPGDIEQVREGFRGAKREGVTNKVNGGRKDKINKL
jgi:hypothetical protein